MGGHGRTIRWSLSAAVTLLVAVPGVAGAQSFAPLNQPGPALSPTAAALRASLQCEPGVRHALVEPVLLNPGTSTTPAENFGWNWEPALDALGIPWCAYTAPNQALNRIDVSGEYLADAIRTVHALAGRRIAVMGHSQGGMSMRWALRFWPDTRSMVADVIGLEPSNHGTTLIEPRTCAILGCPPADSQQAAVSNFIAALNSGAETFAGISYTNLYSHQDEVATPNSGPSACTSCLRTGSGSIANVALQDVCPSEVADHVTAGTTDPVAYALALDALTHPGPANPARIPRTVCSQLLMPGVLNPQSAAAGTAALQAGLGSVGIVPLPVPNSFSGAPVTHTEPPLPCYVYGSCPPSAPLRLTVTPGRATVRRTVHLHVLVTVTVAMVTLPVPQATVWVGNGRHLTTDENGRTTITLAFGKAGRRRVIATAPEYLDGQSAITVKPARGRVRFPPKG